MTASAPPVGGSSTAWMVSLTGAQWLVCIGVALSLIVVEEVRKALRIRAGDEPVAAASTAPAAA